MRNCRLVTCILAAAVFVCLILVPKNVRAQVAGGMLSGTVTDSTGSVIPKAQISIKNMATGVVRTLTTNADGLYAAPNLLPGTYGVTAAATGFNTEVQPSLTLVVGAAQILNFTMKVGSIAEKIEVTGEAPTVQL